MPLGKIYFDLTEDHVKLVRQFNIQLGSSYEGWPCVDGKRPFGNGDWVNDVAAIIGIEKIETDDGFVWPKGTTDRCTKICGDLCQALQVILASGSFEPGKYEADEYHDNWVNV